MTLIPVALILVAMLALLWYAARRRARPRVRTEAQDETVILMTDWLTDQHVLKAAYKTGVLTPIGQQKLLYELGEMDAKRLAVCVGKFLGNREVRQAVSIRMSKQTTYSRAECMAKLGRMAENMKQAEKGLFRDA